MNLLYSVSDIHRPRLVCLCIDITGSLWKNRLKTFAFRVTCTTRAAIRRFRRYTIVRLCVCGCVCVYVNPENCLGWKKFEQVLNVDQLFPAVQWDQTARFHAGPGMLQKG